MFFFFFLSVLQVHLSFQLEVEFKKKLIQVFWHLLKTKEEFFLLTKPDLVALHEFFLSYTIIHLFLKILMLTIHHFLYSYITVRIFNKSVRVLLDEANTLHYTNVYQFFLGNRFLLGYLVLLWLSTIPMNLLFVFMVMLASTLRLA